MKLFISCDWGTSTFRLRLIDAATKRILAETQSAQGIAATYALWKEQAADRILFYSEVIIKQIKLLEKHYGHSLHATTVIISGMASSTIGMIALPYKLIPYQLSKPAFEMQKIPASQTCSHPMILLSGVRSGNDVMRGEETMLAGCEIENSTAEQLFIFPGTHSKQVVVENGILKDFKTFMTGEVFELLSNKSILAASVEADDGSPKNSEAFIKGVRESTTGNFLNHIFHVRTAHVLNGVSQKENYHYLSGLLIGGELKNIPSKNYTTITIVSSGVLAVLYTQALSAMGLSSKCLQQNADDALISGQAFIFNRYQ